MSPYVEFGSRDRSLTLDDPKALENGRQCTWRQHRRSRRCAHAADMSMIIPLKWQMEYVRRVVDGSGGGTELCAVRGGWLIPSYLGIVCVRHFD